MKSPAGEPAPEQPLSQQAYEAVLGMLVDGALRPNEVVTERQIAGQLGMSRTPLREAVRRLEGERLLERQRSGTLVVRPLPVENDNRLSYRIKSIAESFERIAEEHQLSHSD